MSVNFLEMLRLISLVFDFKYLSPAKLNFHILEAFWNPQDKDKTVHRFAFDKDMKQKKGLKLSKVTLASTVTKSNQEIFLEETLYFLKKKNKYIPLRHCCTALYVSCKPSLVVCLMFSVARGQSSSHTGHCWSMAEWFTWPTSSQSANKNDGSPSYSI